MLALRTRAGKIVDCMLDHGMGFYPERPPPPPRRLAVRVVLALPDRDLRLEPLQGGAAGVVGGGAVGGADGDGDARLAHGDVAETVDDRSPEILVRGFEVGGDL